MSDTVVIEGGTVVTHDGQFRADVVIANERITALTTDATDIDADHRIDATGLLVLPGGIDVHTHFREPEEFTKEGFFAGGQGAAAGGITTVIEMPQADPTTVTVEQFQAKRARVNKNALVDMALWAGIVGRHCRIDAICRNWLGPGRSPSSRSWRRPARRSRPSTRSTLYWAMSIVAETGLPYALHAEDDNLVQSGLKRLQDTGRTDPMAHAESRPPLVEAVAVAEALYLAEVTGCWVHICHCASADALRLIADARARGVRVTVETCPQYLSLNTDDLLALKGYGRCAPACVPRTKSITSGPTCWMRRSTCICSDHCGFTKEQKDAGEEDIFRAPMGLAGIQTLLPVFYDGAVEASVDGSEPVRAPDCDESGAGLRSLPAQRHDRDRLGCRYRRVRSGAVVGGARARRWPTSRSGPRSRARRSPAG